MTAPPLFGCIEAGGTKFVVGVARDRHRMLATARIPTTTPGATLAAVIDFFTSAVAEHGDLSALGIASFGPVDVDRSSSHWGTVTRTPKLGWSNADLVGPLRSAFSVPIGFDTDVNGAVLAESVWGAARNADVATYVTVGTGIGGGAIVDGVIVHGSRHPEMGHLLVRRHPADLAFKGVCRFHGDCLEGMASGPAIEARWGMNLSQMPANHPAHGVVAFYLAQMVVAQQAMLSPGVIVIGGGVLATAGLLSKIRVDAAMLSQGYFGEVDYETLVVPPALDTNSGLLGGLALAMQVVR